MSRVIYQIGALSVVIRTSLNNFKKISQCWEKLVYNCWFLVEYFRWVTIVFRTFILFGLLDIQNLTWLSKKLILDVYIFIFLICCLSFTFWRQILSIVSFTKFLHVCINLESLYALKMTLIWSWKKKLKPFLQVFYGRNILCFCTAIG